MTPLDGTTPRAVVLGVGNLLMADEGLGPHAIAALERDFEAPPGVRLIDGGTSAMELLDDLACAQLLLIIDAVAHGGAPASMVVIEDDAVPRFFTQKLSPHQVGLADVLATLAITSQSPRRTVIVGLEPASMKLDLQLSAAAQAALPGLLEVVHDRLAEAGVALRPRAASLQA